MKVQFEASEYQADASFKPARYAFEGDEDRGWEVTRNGRTHLGLGPGYRLLQTIGCGVCSTDLARQFLPFPLPQITGHEIVARDENGNRFAVEINATFTARNVPSSCPFCLQGLDKHSPERLVLGIHDLPGGFGPYVLVPVNAAIPLPPQIENDTAILLEPFAAALHAVRTIDLCRGDRIAVLGPRRLGMLVVAALAALRREAHLDYSITALARRRPLLDLALNLGADAGSIVEGDGSAMKDDQFDVVIDTTGTPAGFDLAIRLATREVHLKSTHGQLSGGITHTTEMVVDEIQVRPFPDSRSRLPVTTRRPVVAWMLEDDPPDWLCEDADIRKGSGASILTQLEAEPPSNGLPRAEIAVVADGAELDEAIRPVPDREVSVLRPRGSILVTQSGSRGDSGLIDAVAGKGLTISTSRCGDLRDAIDLILKQPELMTLGRSMISHRFTHSADDMGHVFDTARSSDCIKAAVWHSAEQCAQ